MNDWGRAADGLPDEQLRVFIFIACATGVAIGHEFMGGFDLLSDQVKKRIPPADRADDFQRQEIEGMFLSHMIKLVTEDLPPCRTIYVQALIPEDAIEKR